MKRVLCFLIILTIFIVSLPYKSYGEIKYVDYIDVKIEHNKAYNEITKLYSDLGFNLYKKHDKNNIIRKIIDKEIHIKGSVNGVDIFDIDGGFITNIPRDGSIIIGSTDMNGSIIKVDENRYRDYITFLNNDNNILIINHIHMENYLLGVVPKEIAASSPVDALRAQAVVARSYTYANLNKHIDEGYNLCTSTHCQVYGGYEWEKPSTNQAVIDTYGEYIVYDGQIASAFYHSNSGGHTESSEDVWGGNLPYLVGIEDRFSMNTNNSTWSLSLSPRDLGDKLKANGIDIGEVKDLQILDTSDSDRVETIKIVGSYGDQIISGDKLRSIIGTTNLKSTLFSINKDGLSSSKNVYIIDGSSQGAREVSLSGMYILDGNNNKTVNRSVSNRIRGDANTTDLEGTIGIEPTAFKFEGKGYGHGVGMSQYGAIEMANLGYNYEEIIKHYYSGVEIINIGK